jgi:ubiquinone/menaquinone biosynthesis C-methylase UbiE
MSETNGTQKGNSGPGIDKQMLCPRWMCFSFDNFLRKTVQNPTRILKPWVKPGDTVLDVGPGVGYFTLPIARLVGEKGHVIAADLQVEMLNTIGQRAAKAGLDKIIALHRCTPESIGVAGPVDFALAFWMVHEVPDRVRFLGEIYAALKPGGLFLLAEPRIHVLRASYNVTRDMALNAGFVPVEEPKIFLSYAVLLKK